MFLFFCEVTYVTKNCLLTLLSTRKFLASPWYPVKFSLLGSIPHKTLKPSRYNASGFLSFSITEHLKLSHFISLGTLARDQKALNIAKLKRHSFNPDPPEVWMKFGMGMFLLFAGAVKLVLYIRGFSSGRTFCDGIHPTVLRDYFALCNGFSISWSSTDFDKVERWNTPGTW